MPLEVGSSVLDLRQGEHAPLPGGVALSTRVDDGRNIPNAAALIGDSADGGPAFRLLVASNTPVDCGRDIPEPEPTRTTRPPFCNKGGRCWFSHRFRARPDAPSGAHSRLAGGSLIMGSFDHGFNLHPDGIRDLRPFVPLRLRCGLPESPCPSPAPRRPP